MSDAPSVFRPVPRTGVIYVMTEAGKRGYRAGHPDWVNLGQGAPETGEIPGGQPRLDTVTIDADTAEYAPVPGLWELREAVAGLYNDRYRRGMKSQYSAENVAISSGGRAGLTRVATALGGVHLGHLLPDYTAYEELLEAFRAFVPIPINVRAEDGFRLPPERLREEILGKGLGAILLSNPCNPTGHAIAGEELAAWVDTCRDLNVGLILDEFYAHYVYGAARHGGVSAAAHVEDVEREEVVILDGLTKNWRYPGLRLSWTLAPKHVIERVSSAGSFLDGGAPHALQRAALPLVDREVADREANSIQQLFDGKRSFMLERLWGMGLQVPSEPTGAFYCFTDLSSLPAPLNDGMGFFHAALERQVICVPGEFFDVNPGNRRSHLPSRMASFVRLSFGPEQGKLEQGLSRLAAMIDETKAA